MKTFVITGCGKPDSLGYRIASQLRAACGSDIRIISISLELAVGGPVNEHFHCNLAEIDSLEEICAFIRDDCETIDCLINCAGLNQHTWFKDVEPSSYDLIMDVNARAVWAVSQIFLGKLSVSNGTILNIVSNASHVPLRCSLAYNASKAAAKMITMQMAKELTQQYGITVFSISPNQLADTGMSKEIAEIVPQVRNWTREYADDYQDSLLLTGEKTDPDSLAEFVAFLLSKKSRHFYLSGCDIPYGA